MNQRPLLSLCKREGQRLSVGIIYNYRSSLCAIQATNDVGELFLFETRTIQGMCLNEYTKIWNETR